MQQPQLFHGDEGLGIALMEKLASDTSRRLLGEHAHLPDRADPCLDTENDALHRLCVRQISFLESIANEERRLRVQAEHKVCSCSKS